MGKPVALWFYHPVSYGDSSGVSARIHANFIMRLKEHYDLYVYGPSEQTINGRELSPIDYHTDVPIKNIISYFRPDVILVYAYGTIKRWMPNIYDAFAEIKCPKVYIEVDYYSLNGPPEKKWYIRNGFTFIQRGYYENSPEESVWLPFSADEEILKYNRKALKNREQKISFTGRYMWIRKPLISHPIRAKAIETLSKYDFFEVNGNKGIVGHEKYPEYIAKSFCALADNCHVTNSPPAKMFEIMAARTLLLTTNLKTHEVLFGADKIYHEYLEDCSDIKRVATDIMYGDRSQQQDMADKAFEIVKKKHMHKHRVHDLLEIMEATIKGKKIPKRWGK